MPLDNTDITDLAALPNIVPVATDLLAVRRPGSVTPLNSSTGAQVALMVAQNLGASGVTAGTYGDATHVGQFTVNTEGLITFAANVPISGGGGSTLAVKSFGVTLTTAALSLNFTTGIQVADDGHGNETISTIFPGVRDYGAKGDGVTDDTTAFVNAAASGGTIYIGAGTYKLTGNVTFPNQVVMLNGATLNVATGVTITFNGGFEAGPEKLFVLTGTAKIAFSPRSQVTALSEWWGAVTYQATVFPVGSPTFSDVAIQAAINSGACIIQLLGGDYYIANALNIVNSYVTLRGVAGSVNIVQNGSSRIAVSGATIDGIVAGVASSPGGTNVWLDHVLIADLTIIRTTAPTSLNGNIPGSPTGLRLRWAVNCTVKRVVSVDHSNAFYITGTASCIVRDCWAQRTASPNGSGWDFFIGFSQDNTPTTPFNSGNASIYHIYNVVVNAASGTFPGGSWGVKIYGGFSDTYIHGLETALADTGIQAQGTTTSGVTFNDENLKITNCVIDQCQTNGIWIDTCNSISQVLIANCYIAPRSTGTGIQISQFGGVCSITGNQIFAPNTGITGLSLQKGSAAVCVGVTSVNNIISDCTTPIVMNGCGLCETQDTINNVTFNAAAGIHLTGSAFRCIVRPVINGNQAARVGIGINIDTGVGYTEVNCTGINPGVLTGGLSANKLVFNGTQITSTGTFGTTCLAQGIMN